MIPVIFGVLIALLINNWNDGRKEKTYLDQVYASIEQELEDSLLDIQRVIPKQLAAVDTLQAYLNDDGVSLYEITIKSNGVHMPTIKTTSWNAISSSRIDLLAYEKLSALADIEERKENLRSRIERQMDFTFQNFENTERSKKEILNMMILDVVGAEKSLMARIEELTNN